MRRRPHLTSTILLLAALVPHAISVAYAQTPNPEIRAAFDDGWMDRWKDIRLAGRANRFTVVDEGDGPVLMARSDGAASALWYRLDIPPTDGSLLAWRWKVASPIPENLLEREKRGDDYAARLFVIFNAEPFSREARAICYVWASGEPVGSTFRNPYYSNVQTVVLRSGDGQAGEWVAEEREFIRDYVEAFGELPEYISAVAVMLDTDNTKQGATAWFDDIVLRFDGAGAAAAGGSPEN